MERHCGKNSHLRLGKIARYPSAPEKNSLARFGHLAGTAGIGRSYIRPADSRSVSEMFETCGLLSFGWGGATLLLLNIYLKLPGFRCVPDAVRACAAPPVPAALVTPLDQAARATPFLAQAALAAPHLSALAALLERTARAALLAQTLAARQLLTRQSSCRCAPIRFIHLTPPPSPPPLFRRQTTSTSTTTTHDNNSILWSFAATPLYRHRR